MNKFITKTNSVRFCFLRLWLQKSFFCMCSHLVETIRNAEQIFFSFPPFGDRYHKVAMNTFVKNKSFLSWRFLNVKNKI